MCLTGEDQISRCIIFDKAFRGNIHIDEYLLIFGQSQADGASHESGVLRRLAPEPEDVHRIGCKTAAAQNARKGEPQPGPKRKYYCGFRTATVSTLALIGNGYVVKLTLDGEGGEAAHVDIALFISSTDKNERATIKVDAGLSLADSFGMASEYVCELDLNDLYHPLHIDPKCLTRGIPHYTDIKLPIAVLPDGN